MQDVARIQPTTDALNIILKNTHFQDDVLGQASNIRFRIDYTASIPVLIFRFHEPFYDFLLVLSKETAGGVDHEWINKDPVLIRMVISDTVVTDRLSTVEFQLDESERTLLRDNIKQQQELAKPQIREIEHYIYENVNSFLK